MLFEDDTNAFIQAKNITYLMAEALLKTLSEWLKDNRLSLSIEKTEYSIFDNNRTQIPDHCNQLTFDNITINRVTTTKYPGIVMNCTLTCEPHVKYLNDQLVRYTGIFKLISKLVPIVCKKKLYYTDIYSRVQYRIDVFGQACAKQLKKVQVMQNHLLKILYQLDWLNPTKDLHGKLSLLTIKDFFLQVSKFVFKQRNNILPPIFQVFFSTNTQVHTHNTRLSCKLHVNRPSSTQRVKTIKYTGVAIFNKLPTYIINCTSLKGFKSITKKHSL